MTGFKSITSLPRDAQVAWMAARQHGVIEHAQLLRAGVARSGVDRRVAAGWLHRKHIGVFAVGHPALTPRGEWMAATLACGSDAVLSHRSAAALWGLAADGVVPSVTVPARRRRGPATIEIHSGRLRPDETLIFDGIKVTSVGRTLLDLAEVMRVGELVSCIDTATNARRLGRNTMSSVISAAKGRHGLKTLKQALLITRPQDVLTRSELERRAHRLIATAGLPAPEGNARLQGYEVDLLWRDARLVVELDSREHHGTDTALDRDTRRGTNLTAHGWTVLRFTWRQVVNDPAWVVESLHAVRSRAACLASPSSSA